MPVARPRLTIARLMIAVGGVGVTLSVARWSPTLGALVGVTVSLAILRAFGAIDRAEAIGATISPARKAFALAASFPVVALLVLMTISTFLLALAVTAALAGAAFTFVSVLPFATWPVRIALGLALLAPATFAAWKFASVLGSLTWPFDLSGPADGIWFVSDLSLGPPPEGRAEPALETDRLDGLAEPPGIPGITGGGAEVGEA